MGQRSLRRSLMGATFKERATALAHCFPVWRGRFLAALYGRRRRGIAGSTGCWLAGSWRGEGERADGGSRGGARRRFGSCRCIWKCLVGTKLLRRASRGEGSVVGRASWGKAGGSLRVSSFASSFARYGLLHRVPARRLTAQLAGSLSTQQLKAPVSCYAVARLCARRQEGCRQDKGRVAKGAALAAWSRAATALRQYCRQRAFG